MISEMMVRSLYVNTCTETCPNLFPHTKAKIDSYGRSTAGAWGAFPNPPGNDGKHGGAGLGFMFRFSVFLLCRIQVLG